MFLESSLPTNFVGRDGFYWWIGQIESDDKNLKPANRFKVRIVGHHLRDCNAVKTEDLPWAQAMLPATTPYSTGNSSGASANFKQGDWVIGFFLDGHEGQQPIIMGSIGAVPNATNNKPAADPNPQKDCKAFTTFTRRDHNPASDQPAKSEAKDANKNQAGVPPAAGGNATAPATLLALPCDNSEANPFGNKFCVALADSTCTEDTSSAFERVLSELFLNVQNSDGRVGSYLISKYTGQVFNYVNVAQGYINKILGILSNLIGRLKGELVKLIRKGVDELLKAILTPKNGGLKNIIEFMKRQLARIGCTLDGLLDRLIAWLTDLIMNYILNIINAATCQIQNMVSDMISQIQSAINGAISSILGALQSILSAIAAPLDLIGSALKYVMDLLGISCSGLGKCNKNKESCTDGSKRKPNKLDEILDALANGDSIGAGYCSDAYENPDTIPTDVIFVGGGTPSVGTGTDPGTTPTTPTTPATLTPTYAVSADKYIASEGDVINYTIATTQITDGTVLNYEFELLNDAVAAQVTGASPSGTVTINNNIATLSITIIDDSVEEIADTLTFTIFDADLNNAAASVNVGIQSSDPSVDLALPVFHIQNSNLNIVLSSSSVANPTIFLSGTPTTTPSSWSYATNSGASSSINLSVNSGATVNANIQVSRLVYPTYAVTADKRILNEGESIKFTITTTNVDDNTVFNYTIFGPNLTPSDLTSNKTTGSFTILNNTAVVTVGIAQDNEVEGLETCVFAVDGTGASIDFSILGTPYQNVTPSPTTEDPTPVACTPQVDSSGRILSIDVCSTAGPYDYPPNVVITGTGFGATAVAKLNDVGYVDSVRVLTPGIGYQPNDNGNPCVVTGFTLIRPGVGYTTAPAVYVNGDSSIVKSKIQEGRVVGFEIVNKTKVFDSFPEIQIYGDGYGALALPTIGCFPIEELNIRENQSISELSQQGSYVDCP
jgi:hypothetical protein